MEVPAQVVNLAVVAHPHPPTGQDQMAMAGYMDVVPAPQVFEEMVGNKERQLAGALMDAGTKALVQLVQLEIHKHL